MFSDLDGDTRINVDGNGADSDNMTFFTAGTQRFVIDNSGNVGIGETSPDSSLEINGNIHITGIEGAWAGGEAYVCVYDNGTIFAKDTSCN